MSARTRERAIAVATTVLVPLALRVRTLPAVLALCDRLPAAPGPRHSPRALAHRVTRWLAYGRGPWASSCLTRSLVLYAMLRQHGYAPRFFVGVAGARARFDAHAWVTLDGAPLLDTREAVDTYAPLVAHGA